ncbi:hypothetical protein CEXT_539151 [Caerostris extrusa]|uniref:Uncharacterized protein n=1 Tax=Caerostris extrusa TaxID=172846 RepID=A0AAV4WMQ7_CAEEX|nr:hypothetical protein CEXT_539151 [Caerostris extrusa]
MVGSLNVPVKLRPMPSIMYAYLRRLCLYGRKSKCASEVKNDGINNVCIFETLISLWKSKCASEVKTDAINNVCIFETLMSLWKSKCASEVKTDAINNVCIFETLMSLRKYKCASEVKTDAINNVCIFETLMSLWKSKCASEVKTDAINNVCIFETLISLWKSKCAIEVKTDAINNVCTFETLISLWKSKCASEVKTDAINNVCIFETLMSLRKREFFVYSLSKETISIQGCFKLEAERPTKTKLELIHILFLFTSVERRFISHSFPSSVTALPASTAELTSLQFFLLAVCPTAANRAGALPEARPSNLITTPILVQVYLIGLPQSSLQSCLYRRNAINITAFSNKDMSQGT